MRLSNGLPNVDDKEWATSGEDVDNLKSLDYVVCIL